MTQSERLRGGEWTTQRDLQHCRHCSELESLNARAGPEGQLEEGGDSVWIRQFGSRVETSRQEAGNCTSVEGHVVLLLPCPVPTSQAARESLVSSLEYAFRSPPEQHLD